MLKASSRDSTSIWHSQDSNPGLTYTKVKCLPLDHDAIFSEFDTAHGARGCWSVLSLSNHVYQTLIRHTVWVNETTPSQCPCHGYLVLCVYRTSAWYSGYRVGLLVRRLRVRSQPQLMLWLPWVGKQFTYISSVRPSAKWLPSHRQLKCNDY